MLSRVSNDHNTIIIEPNVCASMKHSGRVTLFLLDMADGKFFFAFIRCFENIWGWGPDFSQTSSNVE